MAGYLSPLSSAQMNARTPDSGPRTCKSAASFVTAPSATKAALLDDDEITWGDNASSPFETEVDENKPPSRRFDHSETPSKRRSPLKTSPSNMGTTSAEQAEVLSSPKSIAAGAGALLTPSAEDTPRAPATVDRFTRHGPSKSPTKPFSNRLQETSVGVELRDNEGLTMAVSMMEKERVSGAQTPGDVSKAFHSSTFSVHEDSTVDDTCFSTFSEIPNVDMTMFAKLGQRSPTRQLNLATPRGATSMTPRAGGSNDDSIRSPSPTPRGLRMSPAKDGDTTNLLIDFTQQFEAFSMPPPQSPLRRSEASPPKMNTEPDLRSYLHNQRSPGKHTRAAANTPTSNKKNLLNLLDFELPPAPTPRSIPTITVRELESVKSQHLSEMSSIKARLSGREAEVESLKRAVGDAERRAGEAAELVREERSAREHAEREMAEWERRGKDFEEVLRKIREEVIMGEKEKDEVAAKLEDAERRLEDAEAARADAEAKAAEAMSKVFSASSAGGEGVASIEGMFTAEQVQKQIDEKIHTLSTELHAIYKKKHVTKVAGLKKGFEAKTKERTAELEKHVEELTKQNEELQTARDATLSGVHVLPSELGALQGDRKKLEAQKAEFEEQKARMAGLEEEIHSVKASHAAMLKELEAERVEKGELVAAVDEMLALQSEIGAPAAVEDFRKSISRPSGLRGPGFGIAESRIGKIGVVPQFNRSTSSSLASSIARMGAAGR